MIPQFCWMGSALGQRLISRIESVDFVVMTLLRGEDVKRALNHSVPCFVELDAGEHEVIPPMVE